MGHDSQSKAFQFGKLASQSAAGSAANGFVASVGPIRLISKDRVCEILGLKKSAIDELSARGVLPQKIKWGTSRRASVRWVEEEIYAFAWSLVQNRSNNMASDSAQSGLDLPSLEVVTNNRGIVKPSSPSPSSNKTDKGAAR